MTREEVEQAIRDHRRLKEAEAQRDAAREALQVYKRRGDVYTLMGLPVDQAADLVYLARRMLEQLDSVQALLREADEIERRYAPTEGGENHE